MKRSLPFGIAAFFVVGCGTPPDGNNNNQTCVDDPAICGGGTVCDLDTATCVPADCNDDPSICNANETCNAATGECEEVITVQTCTSLDGSATIEPEKVDVNVPGATAHTVALGSTQFGVEGDDADAVFQVTLPTKSDLIVKTIVPQGQTAQDTVITIRSVTCDGDVVATADDINVDGGQAAIVSARSLEAGDYFVFVDSKSTAPILAPVELEVFRTEIVSAGAGCVAGLGAQRCDDGLTCLSPVASGNLEAFNSCEAFEILDTRLFAGDDTGKLYELNPANGTVLAEGEITTPSGQVIPISGTGHYALAYDDINHQLFFHDNQSTQLDDDAVDGAIDGFSPDIKNEVLIFDAETFDRIGQWGTAGLGNNSLGQPFKIEGLAFNRNSNANQRISAFDPTGEVTVVDPASGAFSFDYGAQNADAVLLAGFGVDGFNIEPTFNTPGRGYISRSDDNQLQEFRLGVGTFIRTVSAPPQIGIQCGIGSKGNFAFVGYNDGLIRVVTTVDNVFPGLAAGSFVTEYRAQGLNACALDAGGL